MAKPKMDLPALSPARTGIVVSFSCDDKSDADPWDPAYDETYARSGIYRNDITVLPAERFTDEPLAENRKRELLGEWYAKSVQTGARNSITVEGRFAQICCGWADAAEAGGAVRRDPGERTGPAAAGRAHDVAV